jgi:hypothetical protein
VTHQPVSKTLRSHSSPEDTENEVRVAIRELTAPMTVTFSPANYRAMQKPFTPRVHVLFFCDYGSVQGEECLDVMYNTAPRYRGRCGRFVFVYHPYFYLCEHL